MKKTPPAPAARPFLTPFGMFSLVLNAVLIAWVLAARKPEPPPPPAAESAAKAWPRELSPYAALGSFMAENNRIADLKWTPDQFAAFQDGFR
ncbi:MAG: Peptidyl-prolyl cis-trans isomerase, partial [Verrucomicrobiota bacterium]|nr:Peptidyl-prolyl cis-trans isomerase [Verrucomicrobiota bacterium]